MSNTLAIPRAKIRTPHSSPTLRIRWIIAFNSIAVRIEHDRSSAHGALRTGFEVKAAIWLRVSTGEQHTDNQLPDLRAYGERRGCEVVKVYQVQESAWRGAHQKALTEVYKDARAGRFTVLLVWSLDRLSRKGVGPTLEIVNRLSKAGVEVWSLQEPWLETSGELRDLLLAMVGWVAQYESNRRSERTLAGLNRARANGAKLGRPQGSKDKKKRRRSGYYARYAE